MYLNQEDLMVIATGPPGQGEELLRNLDTELVQLKRQVGQLKSFHAYAGQNVFVECAMFEVRRACAILGSEQQADHKHA